MTKKKKVQIEVKVRSADAPKRKRRRKLSPYQQFTRQFILRTGGDIESAAAAWRKVKKQAKGKEFDVQFN